MNIQPYTQPYTQPGQIGIISGEPNEVYHASKDIGNSTLKDFRDERESRYGSLLSFKRKHIDREPQSAPSRDMELGSAFHDLILLGYQHFADNWTLREENLVFRSRADRLRSVQIMNARLIEPVSAHELEQLAEKNKEPIMDFFAMLPCRRWLTVPERQDVFDMARNLRRDDPLAAAVFGNRDDAHSELVFRSAILPIGLSVQCRLDRYLVEQTAIDGEIVLPAKTVVDVKTVGKLEDWRRSFNDFRYYRQYPFYDNVTRAVCGESQIHDWLFLVIERNPPYAHIWTRPTMDAYTAGERQINEDLLALAQHVKDDDWPRADTSIGETDIPRYHK